MSPCKCLLWPRALGEKINVFYSSTAFFFHSGCFALLFKNITVGGIIYLEGTYFKCTF